MSNSTVGDNGTGIYNDNGAIAASIYNTTMSNNGVEIRNFNAPVVVAMSHTIFNVSPGGHSILNDSAQSPLMAITLAVMMEAVI